MEEYDEFDDVRFGFAVAALIGLLSRSATAPVAQHTVDATIEQAFAFGDAAAAHERARKEKK